MKADLTRSTFRREKHYSGVRMQQGRVQLDADWNEQADIASHLAEATRIDVIGACGVPVGAAGFGLGVTADGQDLKLTPGRAYVEGLICELDASPIQVVEVSDSMAVLVDVVADGHELSDGDWVELSSAAEAIEARVEEVTVSEHRVRFQPFGSTAALNASGDVLLRRIPTYLTQSNRTTQPEKNPAGTYFAYLDAWQRHVTALHDPVLREVALGGADTATRLQTVWQVRVERVGGLDAEVNCSFTPKRESAVPLGNARLRARSAGPTKSDGLSIPPRGGYLGSDNRLYRIEIHDGGDLSTATFKWSRRNASIAATVVGRDGNQLTVAGATPEAMPELSAGGWIEVVDDDRDLAGLPGTFVRVLKVEEQALTIDPETAIASLDLATSSPNPRVRRWDNPEGLRSVESSAGDGWLKIEDGVEVRFEGAPYRSGDHWLIPARTADADVEWPTDSAGNPISRRPERIRHRYCGLGVLRLHDDWEVVEDCRPLFSALANPSR